MNIKLFSFLLLLFFYIAFPVYADNEIYDLKKGFIQINEQRLNSTYTIKAFVNKETSTNKQHFTTFTLPRKLTKPVYTRPALSPLDFLRFGL